MEDRSYRLSDGRILLIREASARDARSLIAHIDTISRESDFLAMGPGEFELTEAEEERIVQGFRDADNHLYLIALLDSGIVAHLSFSAGHRMRVRHKGEFGMSVRKEYWGLGIGGRMLDALIDWARGTNIVTKIDLKVRTDNDRAIVLYMRKGFVIEGTIRREICIDGKYFDHYAMGLEL
jgi:RimJ/RimL family protein N-acetyltransferase